MKVLLVNGSPRRQGNTATALAEVARTLEAEGLEAETMWLGTKPVNDCLDCGRCSELDGRCVMDDVVNELIEKAEGADAFVFGTPVYYALPSGRILCVLDRAFFAGVALPLDALPLADVGLGWVLPAACAAAVGVVVSVARPGDR